MDMRSLVDIIVVVVLCVMSIIALGIVINRTMYFKNVELSSFKTLDELESDLTSYMHLLAAIGANSPYVGLLGTVMGIVATFGAIGEDTSNISGIMQGLSSALYATALGLLVAIPSVLAYNILLRVAKKKAVEWKVMDGRERV